MYNKAYYENNKDKFKVWQMDGQALFFQWGGCSPNKQWRKAPVWVWIGGRG